MLWSGSVGKIAFFAAFLVEMGMGAEGALLMGAGFDLTHSYTVSSEVFFFDMLSAAGLMIRLGPYRYTAQQWEDSPLASVQAESHA